MTEQPGSEPAAPEQGPPEEGVAPPTRERRRRGERRSAPRRAEDREQQFRSFAATFLAFCGALAILYLFIGLIGAVDFTEAAVASAVAIVLALLWLAGAYQRARTGAGFVTRPDRERRGF
jgi:hypothetical protein